MLTVWLYLIGAATAGAYAFGATVGWVPASPAVAAAFLGVAAVFVVSAGVSGRRTREPAADGTPSPSRTALGAVPDDHTLVDGIDDIVFQTDRDAALIFLNRAWKTVTAREAGDCLGTAFFDYVHPDDQGPTREHFARSLQPGFEATRFETRLLCRDGGPCWVDVRLKLRRGRQGQVNGLTGVMTDIQSRKRAEDVLRARDRSLSTLLDHLPGMAFRCRNDRRWTMEFVSEGCFELTGYEAVDLLDHPSYDQLIHPDDRAYVWDYVQGELAQRKAFHLRYRIRTREGRERWVEERSRGIFAGNGTLLAIEGFISDISEQKRDEERLAREPLRDALTGLKSRALLLDRVTAAIEDDAVAPRPFALLCVDLAHLGRINERHGRAVGDHLLASVGERLAGLCRPGVAVGRNGGSQFAVLVHAHAPLPDGRLPELAELARFAGEALGEPHAAGVAWAGAWVEVIAGVLDAPVAVDGMAVSVGARIGIALSVDGPRSAETMRRDAMQAASVAHWPCGGSAVRYAFAGDRIRQSAQRWHHSAGEFDRAFEAGALAVEFATPPAAEWLEGAARWHGARTGPMPPAQMFFHAYQAGRLDALVADYVGTLCRHGLPLLRPGQRLALRLDAMPPAAPLVGAVLAALRALDPAVAARLVVLLAAPPAPGGAPTAADLDALRATGARVAADLTAAASRDVELPAWALLADDWRIGLEPAGRGADEAPGLARLLDVAGRAGVTVVAGRARAAQAEPA